MQSEKSFLIHLHSDTCRLRKMRHLRMEFPHEGTFLDLMETLVDHVLQDEDPALHPFDNQELSLHDIFDVDIEDSNATAVNSLFPDTWLEDNVDLQCHETLPDSPTLPDSTSNASVIDLTKDEEPQRLEPIPEVQEPEYYELPNFTLDCPKVPGINCKSCKFHRDKHNKKSLCCSLCFMRLTAPYTFSKYFVLFLLSV